MVRVKTQCEHVPPATGVLDLVTIIIDVSVVNVLVANKQKGLEVL